MDEGGELLADHLLDPLIEGGDLFRRDPPEDVLRGRVQGDAAAREQETAGDGRASPGAVGPRSSRCSVNVPANSPRRARQKLTSRSSSDSRPRSETRPRVTCCRTRLRQRHFGKQRSSSCTSDGRICRLLPPPGFCSRAIKAWMRAWASAARVASSRISGS